MQLSVVVPALNEADNIRPLVQEICAALTGRLDFEIIYVDDGSTDDTPAVLAALRRELPNFRSLRHARRCGQSAGVRTGVKAARAGWIATLDGDGQNDPADIPALWERAQQEIAASPQPVLIAGWRVKRRDVWSKRIASRFANSIRRSLLRDETPDTGCGLKLFPRAEFLEFPSFNHMHRYLCALMIRQGGRVVSMPVNHRPRTQGVSKYGNLERAIVGLSDLLGVAWLQRRAAIPQATEEK
jgi:dolichol-phosphate mannosyltransferase